MKISKRWAFSFLAPLAFSCRPAGTDIQPIVIDLSAARTPAPSASPTPMPTATPVPPPPTAAPAPAPPPLSPRAEASPAPAHSDVSNRRPPEEVAQRRIEAFNRRELEELVGLYASDARLYEPPDRLRDSGTDQIRQTYARRFASSPDARIMVSQRMTQGNFVVDRETWFGGAGQPQSSLVISEIRDGKIVRAWTLK